jgi:dihydroflavonol-4-reductase
MTEKVVVTGASGHVGANLVRSLIKQGRNVHALVHQDKQALEGLDIKIVEGNICNVNSLYRAFEGADVVYHLAAYITLSLDDWPVVEQINVAGTQNVVDACIKCGVRRLVHFSSIHAFSQYPLDSPIDESRPLVDDNHHAPYDRSKALGKRAVLSGIEKGLDAIIICPTGIIGPYDYKLSHLSWVLMSMAGGKFPALVEGGFDWVDVRDVVDGAMAAEKKAPAGSVYLLSGHWASMADLAHIIEDLFRTPCPGFICPLWLAPAGVPFASLYARITRTKPVFTKFTLQSIKSNQNIHHDKATRELGYNPRPLKETIRDTLLWLADNGYIRLPSVASR